MVRVQEFQAGDGPEVEGVRMIMSVLLNCLASSLVGPYCALSRDYLSKTPIRRTMVSKACKP